MASVLDTVGTREEQLIKLDSVAHSTVAFGELTSSVPTLKLTTTVAFIHCDCGSCSIKTSVPACVAILFKHKLLQIGLVAGVSSLKLNDVIVLQCKKRGVVVHNLHITHNGAGLVACFVSTVVSDSVISWNTGVHRTRGCGSKSSIADDSFNE
jgi:hypothetical protein